MKNHVVSAIVALFATIALAIGLHVSLTHQNALIITVGSGWGDLAHIQGLHGTEEGNGETYRWTTGNAEIRLPNVAYRYRAFCMLAHSWRPEGTPVSPVTIAAEGQPIATLTLSDSFRRTCVSIPPRATATRVISLQIDTFSTPQDDRELGIALSQISLEGGGSTASAPVQYGGQLALMLLWAALAVLIARGFWPGHSLVWVGVGALAASTVIWLNLAEVIWVGTGLWYWLGSSLAASGAFWLMQRHGAARLSPWLMPAHQHAASALLAVALLIRLLGATHPLFDLHDLGFHTRWLRDVLGGDLFLYSTPSEFQGRATVYPPVGYLLLLPLRLLFDGRLTLQIGLALLDTLACWLVLLLARALELPGRAGVLALALYAALPVVLTMQWWGFATNAIAQPIWLVLVLLVLAVVRRPRPALIGALVAATLLMLLSHVGAIALGGITLALALLFGWRHLSWRALAAVAGAGSLAIALVYVVYYAPALTGAVSGDAAATTRPQLWQDTALRITLISTGFARAFELLPALLVPVGIGALLVRPTRLPLSRALPVAWALTFVGFVLVYIIANFVVREIYFLAPMACLGLALLLDALWKRGWHLLALVFVLLIAGNGVLLWFGGVLARIKPSALPLTH